MDPAKRRSSVWDHFEIITEDSSKAKCQLCNSIISRGGVGKLATPSGMINHLKHKHYHEYNEYEEKETKVKEAKRKRAEEHPTKKKLATQLTLSESFNRNKQYDINSDKAVAVHNAIARMIVLDNQPISVVTDLGFKKLLNTLDPKYNIPSRTYFLGTVIPKLYEKCKTNILKKLTDASSNTKISFTTDIWSCRHNNESFISWTAHWLSTDFEIIHAVLNVSQFPGHHTSANISKIISETLLKNWNINKESVHLVLSDNAANMVRGIQDLKLASASCFLHSLQLVINTALKSQRTVTDMITVAKKIVGHFNHSSLAYYKLKKIQADLQMPEKQLIQDTTTRWNSTYFLLERLLEQKRCISLYCSENDLGNLSANQWSLLEGTLHLLKPFEQVTRKMSSSRSVISEVIPTLRLITHFLNKESQLFFGVGSLKENLLKELTTRFSDIEKNYFYTLATILDPRYKGHFFTTNIDTNKALYEQLIITVDNNTTSVKDHQQTDMNAPQTPDMDLEENRNQPSTSETCEVLWDCFDEIITSVTLQSNTETSSIQDEVNKYLTGPLLDRNSDPTVWWKSNAIYYPNIAQLARVYLSAPSNTVYSERVFSEAGNVYEEHRSKLTPQNAETLIFLHHNLLSFEV